jgi:hypothetical protein
MKCNLCNTDYALGDSCPSCGFPKDGTDQDKVLFLAEKEKKKQEFRKIEKEFDIERITAFVIGGLLTVFAIISIFNTPDFIKNLSPVIIFFPIVAILYGIFITKKPLMTTSLTFIAILVILIAEFLKFKGDIFDNAMILIIDAVVIIGCARGIYYAYKFKKLEKIK